MRTRVHSVPGITAGLPCFRQSFRFQFVEGSLQRVCPAVIGLGLQPCDVLGLEALPIGDLPEKRHHARIVLAFDISYVEALSQFPCFTLSPKHRIVRHSGKGLLDRSGFCLIARRPFSSILHSLRRSFLDAYCMLLLGPGGKLSLIDLAISQGAECMKTRGDKKLSL
ncbi:hypothetical protein CBR61_00415 [Porphyrobacter sp. CACIAM 03H1]|nr:hypothetical protein CBR61_00415 [Porphyrobacter sp. CACIAM 03H1]